jgi:hypothetical protein
LAALLRQEATSQALAGECVSLAASGFGRLESANQTAVESAQWDQANRQSAAAPKAYRWKSLKTRQTKAER